MLKATDEIAELLAECPRKRNSQLSRYSIFDEGDKTTYAPKTQ